MLRFRPISLADPCKKYIAYPCIASHVSVKEQNLRNGEDVTKTLSGSVGPALRRKSVHADVRSS